MTALSAPLGSGGEDVLAGDQIDGVAEAPVVVVADDLFDLANESHSDSLPLMFGLHGEVVDPTTSSVPASDYTAHDLIELFSN